MNIALVTNENLHHKFWVTKLCEKFDVKLIIHPQNKYSIIRRIKTKKLNRYGITILFLRIMSIIYSLLSNNSFRKKNIIEEKKYFNEYLSAYEKIDKNKILYFETINCEKAIENIRNNEIDIICFLGGDIAKKEFINSAQICTLNFHSGISPFYNGNKTIFHAFSDLRPNFAGGTLMYMNERIDGGKILSHYLPSLEQADSASSVFMKNIQGAVKLYADVLKEIESGKIPTGISQRRSFRYLRNLDWNIINDLKLRYVDKSKLIKRYLREEMIIHYYDGSGDYTFSKTLKYILNK